MASDATKLSFCAAIGELMDKEDFADFTILCGDSQWKVHRVVLLAQSPVFAATLSSELKDKNQLDLSAHDAIHVKGMVKYLYKFDYDVDEQMVLSDKLCVHVSMCIIANEYAIAGLKTLATTKFSAIASPTCPPTAADLAIPARVSFNAETATAEICEAVLRIILRVPSVLNADDKELEATMTQYPQIAIRVAKAQLRALTKMKEEMAALKSAGVQGAITKPVSTDAVAQTAEKGGASWGNVIGNTATPYITPAKRGHTNAFSPTSTTVQAASRPFSGSYGGPSKRDRQSAPMGPGHGAFGAGR